MTLRGCLVAGMLAGWAAVANGAEPPPDAEQRLQAAQQRLQVAQERLEAAAKEVAELSMAAGDHGRPAMRTAPTDDRGPMLGINIDTSEPRGGASRDGVRILSVSPGGPGAAAGLVAGDVITSFNGKALTSTGTQAASAQLVAAVAATKVGASVPIEYRRDGSTIKTTIRPAPLPPEVRQYGHFDGLPVMPDLRGLRDFGGSLSTRMFAFAHHDSSGFGSAELVELSPTLGKYFGTDRGLLVVRAPREAQLKLQDGDVLLDVDGRVPTGVGHAYQILSSYQPGESLKLHIMRQQHRTELQVIIPAGKT